jgi:hypothetical protein
VHFLSLGEKSALSPITRDTRTGVRRLLAIDLWEVSRVT